MGRRARRRAANGGEVGSAASIFACLAGEGRLRILLLLLASPACVCQIERDVGLSQPTVSYHLKVLRSAGLICGYRQAPDHRWIRYGPNPKGIARLSEAIAGLAGRPSPELIPDENPNHSHVDTT